MSARWSTVPGGLSARRVLMIAYHFPPLAGSSGIQRTLRFVQHLPALGWEPIVLTVKPWAYERCSDDLLPEIPPGIVVRRAFALDTARQMSIAGRYIGSMARPDRWISWRWDGVRTGLQMIREFRPELVWSTYPIATAHVIGAALSRRADLPWIADFRDPMAQPGYPSDPPTWERYKEIESTAMAQAALSVFTTPGAASYYRRNYPLARSEITVIENGYDEDSFVAAALRPQAANTSPFVLLHSGIVYPSERDPTQVMAALRQLVDANELRQGELVLRFRAAVHDDILHALAETYGVQRFIETAPALPYREALAEMLAVDSLLVLQASNCNEQIPAKLYEYLRAGRPILGLTDPVGDTAGVLRNAGFTTIAPLDNAPAIAKQVLGLMRSLRAGTAGSAAPAAVAAASRKARAIELATWLDRVAANARARGR